MGRKVLELLVAPVATGVYSASPDDLDVEVVAPGLNAALTRLGSLSGAVGELRAAAKAGSAVGGIRGGMWRLPEALAADIETRGGEVRTDARVVSVERWSADEADDADDADDATPRDDAAGGRAASRQLGRAHARTATGSWRTRSRSRRRPTRPWPFWRRSTPRSPTPPSLDWPAASSVELVTLVIEDDRLGASPGRHRCAGRRCARLGRPGEGDDALQREVGLGRRGRRTRAPRRPTLLRPSGPTGRDHRARATPNCGLRRSPTPPGC